MVRKICEIDATQVYNEAGVMPWRVKHRYSHSRTRHRLKATWFEAAFTPAQRTLLTKIGYTARPHPRHSPSVEIYIDHHNCTEQDWTMLRLIF